MPGYLPHSARALCRVSAKGAVQFLANLEALTRQCLHCISSPLVACRTLGLTPKQARDNSRVREGKRTEKTTADGVKTRKTVYTDFAR